MERLRQIIREQIEVIFEDFKYRYEGKFTPTDEMVKTCQKILTIVEVNNLIQNNNSNEGSGLSKAKKIIIKEPMTHSQLKRMKAFFDNNEIEFKSEKNSGKNIKNSGIMQSWDLWGGDAGKLWCERLLKQRNSSNNSSKTIRNSHDRVNTSTLMNPHNTRIHK